MLCTSILIEVHILYGKGVGLLIRTVSSLDISKFRQNNSNFTILCYFFWKFAKNVL
jgi:hypothetical protein